MSGEELKPAACPFCGAGMSHCIDRDGEFWMHPGTVTDDDCFMSGQGIFPRQLAAWNRRAYLISDKSDNDAVFRSSCGASTSQGADGRHAPNVAHPLLEQPQEGEWEAVEERAWDWLQETFGAVKPAVELDYAPHQMVAAFHAGHAAAIAPPSTETKESGE